MGGAPARQRRVLLGNIEPMACLGMSRLLAEEGVEVLVEDGADSAIVARVSTVLPDVVVLDLDGEHSRRLEAEVRLVAPRAKVILWAQDESEMVVFDGGDSEPRRIAASLPEALRRELQLTPVQRGGA
jgi:AmiR/NasT family two-component response regulator